jgi:two-component sensor histidine kinase
MTGSDGCIELSYDLDKVSVTTENATYCGLLLNEMLVNCYKYAFQEELTVTDQEIDRYRMPRITVRLDSSDPKGNVELAVIDNGMGMEEIDHQNPDTLGMTLIQTFVKQLKGQLDVKSKPGYGTTVKVRFFPN